MPDGDHHPRGGPDRRPPGPRLATTLTLAGLLLGTLGAAPAGAAPPAEANPATGNTVDAATEPFVDEQVLFQERDLGYACFRIPAIVRATNGTVLAFAEGRVADCGDDGDIDLVLRRSTDGGRTWGPLQVVSEGNGETHGNPVPIVDQRTGRIVLLTTHNGPEPCTDGCDRDPYLQISDDHGATWTAPRELTEGKLPEWNHWYASGPVHGIQLERGPHAGRLVAGVNFESWDRVGDHRYGAMLLYSDDSGQTWHRGASWAEVGGALIPQEVTVVELTDGRIYALARERGSNPGTRAYAISSDGGETFDKPFRMLPELVMPEVQGATLRLRATDRGDARDRILFSGPAHGSAREVMTIRSSYDEARSWETWQEGKVFYWGPSAYSDLVRLDGDEAALLYEAGVSSPYEGIRYARFNEAYLDTPNGTPPGIPAPPEPGPKTPDYSPYRNDAYVRGGAGTVPGRFGRGLALDRVDDRIEVPFNHSIDLGADDFTISTWIRYAETTGAHTILWAYRMGSGPTPQLWLRAEPASNRIRAMLVVDRFQISISSPQAYNDGQWHHVALRRIDGRFVMSVDGVEVAAATAPPGSVTAGKEFGVHGIFFGQRVDGADRFRGTFDELRVYRRALSDTELRLVREYNLPIGGRLGLRLPLEAVR